MDDFIDLLDEMVSNLSEDQRTRGVHLDQGQRIMLNEAMRRLRQVRNELREFDTFDANGVLVEDFDLDDEREGYGD